MTSTQENGTINERIAVVGAGISGMAAALRLAPHADVTLIEAEPRLGGHAHTRTTSTDTPVDTGFIVYNEPTYPLLTQLFEQLDVVTKPAPMSFAVTCEECGLEISGGTRRQLLASVFGHRRALPLMLGIVRFRRAALRALASGDLDPAVTLRAWAERTGMSALTISHYLVPLTAAVWSTAPGTSLDMPALTTLRFLDNHALLRGSPHQWRTVTGGSATYVAALRSRLEELDCTIAEASPITGIRRTPDGVELSDATGATHTFDRVIVATHPDTALALLTDATPTEQSLLGAWNYTDNEVVLHRDPSVLPSRESMWGAWNYRLGTCDASDGPARLTYQMDLLQTLGGNEPWSVTVNPANGEIDPDLVEYRTSYAHPQFTAETWRAQSQLHELDAAGTDTDTWFCGAWRGHGFHEDGIRAGYAAADALHAARSTQVPVT